MRITVDEKGYVTGWSIAGDEEGILCEIPENFDHFMRFYRGYRYESGKLTEDPHTLAALQGQYRKEEIRRQREEWCFPYINRGALWYEKLTQDQRAQLGQWYEAWLDAPETMTIPETPEWLD